MKLSTLIAYQRSYNLMREIEMQRPLTSDEYIGTLRAKAVFDYELAEHLKPINVEITNEAHR